MRAGASAASSSAARCSAPAIVVRSRARPPTTSFFTNLSLASASSKSAAIPVEHRARLDVVGGKRAHRVDGDLAAAALEDLERAVEPLARRLQEVVDLARQRPRRLEQRELVRIVRVRRIVDQQHDVHRRVLLQRRRQQRLPDDRRVLAVRRDDHRQARRLRREERVDRRARHPLVPARSVREPEPRDEIGERRAGEQRHDDEVDDRVGRVADAERVAEERLRQRGRHEGDPADERDEDREARRAQQPFRTCRGNGRQRAPPVATPLPPLPCAPTSVILTPSGPHQYLPR